MLLVATLKQWLVTEPGVEGRLRRLLATVSQQEKREIL